MKKILLIIIVTFMSVTFVNADTIILNTNNELESSTYCSIGCDNTFEESINNLMLYRDPETYKYYAIFHNNSQIRTLTLVQFNDTPYTITTFNTYIKISFDSNAQYVAYSFNNDRLNILTMGVQSPTYYFNFDEISLIDSNFNFILNGATYEIQGFYEDSIILEPGMPLPTYLNLKKYSSWSEYSYANPRMREVNLDNYEYVILNLKNYNQADAFDTNLQVKGMIGITPVYEFGMVEKPEITDRCNISYTEYTDYRLYVLKNDLTNNAVYYVKSCEENSSFKFDSTIFNITYITADTVDNPVITVGGVQYNTIPFNELNNSANENEDNNFIPGENGSSFTDVFSNISDYISSFWNSLLTFMGFVTKLFNTLPVEVRAISITMFITGCTLGLIKIIKA